MTSVLSVGIGNNVHLVPSAHGDGDVFEGESGQGDFENNLEGVFAVDSEPCAERFWARVEKFDTVTPDHEHVRSFVDAVR